MSDKCHNPKHSIYRVKLQIRVFEFICNKIEKLIEALIL